MWRSIAGARRCTISLRGSATSYSTGKAVPQVHRHVIKSPNIFNFSSSLNPTSLYFSTNSVSSSNHDNGLSSSDPTFTQSNLHSDEKMEYLGEKPVSINVTSDEFDENQLSVSSEIDEDGIEENELVVKDVDLEQLECVLSLLQSSTNPDEETNPSLDSTLDEMNLSSLSEEFVERVLKTPLVPGENLVRFFKWAIKKTESFSPTSRSLEALVHTISGQKNAYAVWDLIKEIGENGNNDGLLTTSTLNGLISLLSNLGKAKAVFEVFNKFDDFGCVPDSDTYYIAIDALCRRSFYDWACLVVEKMISSEKLPDGERVGKITSYLCKGEKYKEAHSVYLLAKKKNKHPPRSSVNFLISSLSRNNETVGLGLDMLSDFSGEERKYAIKPFSSVMRGLCRIKDMGPAKDLLSKMIEEGPPPGNSVFNSIINSLSKAGDMGEAKELVKMMRSRGLKPDVFTYTVIMSGYVKGGEMEEACKVLSEAKEEHSKLSTVTYHTLVRGYCKLGEFEKAVKLLGEMREFGVEPNVDEYNKLIQTLCLKALDWGTAEKLLEEMRENGLQLNGTTKALLRAVKEVEIEEEGSIVSGGGEETVAVAA